MKELGGLVLQTKDLTIAKYTASWNFRSVGVSTPVPHVLTTPLFVLLFVFFFEKLIYDLFLELFFMFTKKIGEKDFLPVLSQHIRTVSDT